jgi:hypothetical protein
MAPVTETQKARPLTEDEKKVLRELMTRENAWAGPDVRVGELYEALVNLSVPRRGDVDRQCDLVRRGETLYLTEEEARQFNRHDGTAGRQVEVVRKLSGPDGSREALPAVPPRALSGRVFRPQAPVPGTDGPRPDPAGSSRVEYLDDAPVPERDQPQPDPAHAADVLRSELTPDAVDLPPRRGPGRPRANGGA